MRRRASPHQLYKSWEAWRKPSWPPTYEDCLKDPIIFRIIEMRALQHERARRATPPATRWVKPAPAFIDRKRLAAGEKEEE